MRSRSASSSPKNSVNATRNPVVAAQSRKSAAGSPIQRCQRRQDATLVVAGRAFARYGAGLTAVESIVRGSGSGGAARAASHVA